jgi:flagellar biosynthetic protein FlhB
MAESSHQEKTEAPTQRRLGKAREEGQVARSSEVPAAAVVVGGLLLLLLSGPWLISLWVSHFASTFVIDSKIIATPALLPDIFARHAASIFMLVFPVVIVLMVLAVAASGLTGGYFFSVQAVMPKGSKLNPVEGLKRIFGMHALVELGKALFKFTLVASVLWLLIYLNLGALIDTGKMSLEPALAAMSALIMKSALTVGLALVVVAALDAPLQKYQFMKKMRMTRQEVKDELKDMEGRPEVKAQIRRRQREMANARMMKRIKEADVVITNPEQFAVALKYEPGSDSAPILIAKGVDFMAMRIREEAGRHAIHIFEAPPLSRALYYTTEIDRAIPETLYRAVAEVIAYVFALEAQRPGTDPLQRPDPRVPPEMHFDAAGRVVPGLH